MGKVIVNDDSCYTDEQLLGEVAEAAQGVGSIWNYVNGMRGVTWNNSSKFEKLTLHEMHHNIHAKQDSMDRERPHCPIKMMFWMVKDEVKETMMSIMPAMPAKPVWEMPHFDMGNMPHFEQKQMSWGLPPVFQMPGLQMPQFF